MNLQELIQRIRSWFYPVIDLGRVQQFKEVGIIPYFSYSYLKPKKEVEGYCSLLFPNLNECYNNVITPKQNVITCYNIVKGAR